MTTDETNAPRCEFMSRPDGGRCRAQGAGVWPVTPERDVVLCDDDRRRLAEDLRLVSVDELEWRPFLETTTLAAIERRVELCAAGYFG